MLSPVDTSHYQSCLLVGSLGREATDLNELGDWLSHALGNDPFRLGLRHVSRLAWREACSVFVLWINYGTQAVFTLETLQQHSYAAGAVLL